MGRWILLGILLVSSSAASAAGISVATSWLTLWTGDSTAQSNLSQSYTVPFFASDSRSNQINGSYAQATYDISTTGITIDYSLLRSAYRNDQALELAQADGYIEFSVDEPVSYVLAGEMNTVDPEGRNTTQWLQLFDNGVRIVNAAQLSHATQDPQFVLGRQDGDFDNVFIGTLTGTLLPRHVYRFEYFSRLLDEPSPSRQAATATGFYSLLIVPEPSTAMLVYLGLIALAGARRLTDEHLRN